MVPVIRMIPTIMPVRIIVAMAIVPVAVVRRIFSVDSHRGASIRMNDTTEREQ
jgi:hypothetical protein